ncbi:MAG: hypothetical protein CME06_06275 [Gemmatimonadetes bacterium]|nr:hypothetical protein [Gemmatimonadota bacterium]
MKSRNVLLVAGVAASASFSHATESSDALLRRGLEDHAAVELDAAIRASDDAVTRVELLLKLANLHESRLDDLESAAAAYVRALEELPEGAARRDEIHYKLARALEASGDTGGAAAEYQAILVGHPKSPYTPSAGEGVERCFELNRPRVAASVGEHIITMEALDRIIEGMDALAEGEIARKPERRAKILRQMVDEKLMADLARSTGLHLERGIREDLERNVDRYLARHTLQRRVKDPVEIGGDAVQAYYDENLDTEFYVEARARGFVFILDDEGEAEKVMKRLNTGEFSEVRNELWKDSQAKGGGDSGLHEMSYYSAELAAALAKIEIDRATEPMRSDRGWEVFYLQVHTPGRHTPLDKVQARIEAKLRGQAEAALYEALIDSLEIETAVAINPVTPKSAPGGP